MTPLYRDRRDAGTQLADRLRDLAGSPDLLVLALPRGGLPVAYPVARALGAPLDVFLVRKLGYPGQEELAMGAVASGGLVLLDDSLTATLPPELLRETIARAREELERRERAYRGARPLPRIRGRTVVLVDDGLATGASMRAALRALRREAPARLVVAVPVAARSTCEELADEADAIVCGATPEPFFAVGLWYEDFSQTTDDEVRELLARAEREAAARERLRDAGEPS